MTNPGLGIQFGLKLTLAAAAHAHELGIQPESRGPINSPPSEPNPSSPSEPEVNNNGPSDPTVGIGIMGPGVLNPITIQALQESIIQGQQEAETNNSSSNQLSNRA